MVALCLLSHATVAAGFTGLSHTAASVLSSALQPAASLPAPDANVTASIKTAVGQLFSTQRAKVRPGARARAAIHAHGARSVQAPTTLHPKCSLMCYRGAAVCTAYLS